MTRLRTLRFAAVLLTGGLGCGLAPGLATAQEQPAATTTPAPAAGHAIGDVLYSILPPEQFQQVHAGFWVLADGRDLPADSDLRAFLIAQGRTDLLQFAGERLTVPDARGMFIRSLNLARPPAEGDPEGTGRRMGSYQTDQVGEHEHTLSYPQHTRRAGRAGEDRFNAPWSDNTHTPRGTERTPNPANEADVETRPRNIALYTYLKISD